MMPGAYGRIDRFRFLVAHLADCGQGIGVKVGTGKDQTAFNRSFSPEGGRFSEQV